MNLTNLFKNTLLGLSLLAPWLGSAQHPDRGHLDSLRLEIAAAKQDTDKVNLLLQSGYAWVVVLKMDSAVSAYQQALRLAQKLGWEKGGAKAYRDIGTQYFAKAKYTTAYRYFNSAFVHGLAANEDDLAVRSLSYAGSTLYYQNKF